MSNRSPKIDLSIKRKQISALADAFDISFRQVYRWVENKDSRLETVKALDAILGVENLEKIKECPEDVWEGLSPYEKVVFNKFQDYFFYTLFPYIPKSKLKPVTLSMAIFCTKVTTQKDQSDK